MLSLLFALPTDAHVVGSVLSQSPGTNGTTSGTTMGASERMSYGIAVYLSVNDANTPKEIREKPDKYQEHLLNYYKDYVCAEQLTNKVIIANTDRGLYGSDRECRDDFYATGMPRETFGVVSTGRFGVLVKSAPARIACSTSLAEALFNHFNAGTIEPTPEGWQKWLQSLDYNLIRSVHNYDAQATVSQWGNANIDQMIGSWSYKFADDKIKILAKPYDKNNVGYYLQAAAFLDQLACFALCMSEDQAESTFNAIKYYMAEPDKTKLTIIQEPASPAWIYMNDAKTGYKAKPQVVFVPVSAAAEAGAVSYYSPYVKGASMPDASVERKNPNAVNSNGRFMTQPIFENYFIDKGTNGKVYKNLVGLMYRKSIPGDGGRYWTFAFWTFTSKYNAPSKSGSATHNLSIYDPLNKDLPVYPDNHVVRLTPEKETVGVDIHAAVPIVPNGDDLLKELDNELVDKNNIWLNVNVSRKAESNKNVSRNITTPVMWYEFKKETNTKPLSQIFLANTISGTKILAKKVGTDFTFNTTNPAQDVKVDGEGKTWIRVSFDEFKNIFYHGKEKGLFSDNSLIFVDKTKDVKLGNEEIVKYTYNSSVNLAYFKKPDVTSTQAPNYSLLGTKNGWVTKEIKAPQERSVSFTRSKKGTTPPSTPETKKWSTQDTLLTYSEYKHNRPFAEEYEAMAGVPTMEPMFYSIGGTPYLIEMDIEKVKKG